jgi:hypothetical protein
MKKQIQKRIKALLQHSDPEVRWLAGYAHNLMLAGLQMQAHLERISSPNFEPRIQLEKALEDR